MKLGKLLSHEGRRDVAAIIDLGSSTVNGALVELRPNGKPLIRYATREPLALHEKADPEHLMRSMLSGLLAVTLRLQDEGIRGHAAEKKETLRVTKCLVIVGSPWYVSENRFATLEKQRPFKITRDLITEITEAERKKFAEAHGADPKGKAPLEHATFEVALNEYIVPNPYGLHARKVQVGLFESVMSATVRTKALETVASLAPHVEIQFHTRGLALFTVLRDLFLNEYSYLITDITGEVTDILLIYEGKLCGISSIPIGTHGLIRGIQKRFKIGMDDARAKLELLRSGKLDKTEAEEVEQLIQEGVALWQNAFNKELGALSKDVPTPRRVLLSVDSRYAEWFSNSLQKAGAPSAVFSDRGFLPYVLSNSSLRSYCEMERATTTHPLVPLNALFLQKLESGAY